MAFTLDELRGRVFSIDEVADLLGVKPEAIRRRVRLGQLPVRRPPGSEMVVSGDELAAYLLGETPAPRPKKAAAPARGKARVEAVPSKVEAPRKPQERRDASAPVIPFRLPDEAKARLREWMNATGRNGLTVARESGINASSLSYIIGTGDKATRALCRDNALRLRDAYGDALLRYLMGDGPMPKG